MHRTAKLRTDTITDPANQSEWPQVPRRSAKKDIASVIIPNAGPINSRPKGVTKTRTNGPTDPTTNRETR